MQFVTDWIVKTCLNNQIITEQQIPWFKYGIEKRISSIVVMIPLFVLSILLANLGAAIAFIISFYLIRSSTNGYHAKTPLMCLILSIIYVFVFMGLFYRILNKPATYIVAIVSFIIIFLLAPFDNVAMHFSNEEIMGCRKKARRLIILLVSCIACTQIIGLYTIAKGLSLGIAMAAYLLCLAYILDGGKKYEQNRKNQKHGSRFGRSND